MKKTIWELSQASWGGNEVVLHLADGWEPFAVTQSANDQIPATVWFRRKARS